MDVKLPKLGEGADSGIVVSILVKEGDAVKEGQTIIELENEKAVAPVPSSVAGTVSRIRVKEGDKVTVGQVILSVGGESKERPSEDAGPAPHPDDTEPVERERGEKRGRREGSGRMADPHSVRVEEILDPPATKPAASPAVRRMSGELGIDLARVRGTERGGRVGLADVRRYIEALQRLAFKPQPAPDNAAEKPAAERVDFSKWGPVEREPMSQLRQVIAARMAESWNSIPHVTQFDDADITDLLALRKKHSPAFEAQGAKLTLTGFVIRAVVRTLKQHPIFNSSLDDSSGELVLKRYYHIGLAVDTEAGLIVPVIRDADRKSLLEISREIESLAGKARDRKISLEELKGGSFTISNQGGIGGAHFTPIVNKPEVAILGLGRGILQPVIRDKKVEPRWMLPLGLSYDHRVIDGGSAARFIVDLTKALAEFPENELES